MSTKVSAVDAQRENEEVGARLRSSEMPVHQQAWLLRTWTGAVCDKRAIHCCMAMAIRSERVFCVGVCKKICMPIIEFVRTKRLQFHNLSSLYSLEGAHEWEKVMNSWYICELHSKGVNGWTNSWMKRYEKTGSLHHQSHDSFVRISWPGPMSPTSWRRIWRIHIVSPLDRHCMQSGMRSAAVLPALR